VSGLVSFRLVRELERFPGTLLGICVVLLALSLVVLRSASLAPDGTTLHYMSKQVVWAGAGLTVFLVLCLVPYPQLTRRAWILYALGLLALIAVFVIGTKVNGSRRWFSLGPVRVQPSEFMKYLLVIALARTIAARRGGIRTARGLAEVALVTAVPFLLVMAQPDLGTGLSFLPIAAAMAIAAGARWRHLLAVVGAGVAAAPFMWAFVLRDYQKDRILSFLDAKEHALAGAYQTTQSVIAIGSGGLFGRGYMAGTQGPLGFLPERHTDFVFAVVCEDFGLLGGVLLLGTYGYLLCALAQVARATRDPEGRLLVVGVSAITVFQIAQNVGMALGIMPVTGLTLPLVSYGGSSLVASMIGFGLAASVARHRALVFTPAEAARA